MILNICSEPRVLSIIRIIKVVITIIKIAVPIILILSIMISYMKVLTNNDTDALSKTNKSVVPKLIAAILVFLIPTLVHTLTNLVSSDNEYYDCIKSSTKEGVRSAYVKRAEQMVLDAKNTLNTGLYTAAKVAVSNLDEGSEKTQLQGELTKVYEEIEQAREERKKKEEEKRNTGGVNADGKYTKAEIIAMTEQQVRDMSNEEFILFMASAARIVYSEYGGVLPSITIAQAILESGWGNHFTNTTHNVFGLIGYPGNKPKVGRLRQFDNFYEATYYHYAYFPNYPHVYTNFLNLCAAKDALGAASYLYAYANGSQTYAPNIQSLITQYNLTQYDN